ncbi:MAG TPA: ATP-binding protein, partial [Parvularculaceae bacterium]|nr:ATP-binding protein [Parvularculaceae bacterium]
GHIVENAINASKNGSQVFIRCRKARDGAYLLEIVDRGVGMSPEKIKSALSPFAHMESFRTRTSEGVGLGLALARKILQDQNADISLRSQPDEGTTVTIRFAAPKDTGEDRRAVA